MMIRLTEQPVFLTRAISLPLLAGVTLGALALTADHAGLAGVLPLLAVTLAACAASVVGFAFAALCSAVLLPLIDDPFRVVGIAMLCSIGNQVLMTWRVRHAIRLRALAPFLAGGILGVPLGTFALMQMDTRMLVHALGVLTVLLAVQRLAMRTRTRPQTLIAVDVAFGVLGGIAGGFCGFAGAPVAIRASMKPWDKDMMRGVTQPFILILQIEALTLMTLLRGHGQANALSPENLVFLPLSLAGCLAGLELFRAMTDRQFLTAVNLAILVSGLGLLM